MKTSKIIAGFMLLLSGQAIIYTQHPNTIYGTIAVPHYTYMTTNPFHFRITMHNATIKNIKAAIVKNYFSSVENAVLRTYDPAWFLDWTEEYNPVAIEYNQLQAALRNAHQQHIQDLQTEFKAARAKLDELEKERHQKVNALLEKNINQENMQQLQIALNRLKNDDLIITQYERELPDDTLLLSLEPVQTNEGMRIDGLMFDIPGLMQY